MSDAKIKYQDLKYKVFGKTDEEFEEIIKPLEVRYAPVRRLKTAAKTSYLAVMRYLLLMYDPQTDLNRDYVTLMDRKTEASKVSGLIKLSDLKIYGETVNCIGAVILDVIQVLLSEVFHDRDYREWQTLNNELDEYTNARWEKPGSSRKRGKKGEEVTSITKADIETLNLKSKLREECDKIIKSIDQLERKIFGDNKDLKELAYVSRYQDPESFSRAARQVDNEKNV